MRKRSVRKSGTKGCDDTLENHAGDSSANDELKKLAKVMKSRVRRAGVKAQRQRDKLACSRCGGPAAPGKPMCEKHVKQRKNETIRRYRKRTAPENRRLCVDCGKNPRYSKITRCLGCNESHNERVRRSRRSPKTGSTQLHLALTS